MAHLVHPVLVTSRELRISVPRNQAGMGPPWMGKFVSPTSGVVLNMARARLFSMSGAEDGAAMLNVALDISTFFPMLPKYGAKGDDCGMLMLELLSSFTLYLQRLACENVGLCIIKAEVRIVWCMKGMAVALSLNVMSATTPPWTLALVTLTCCIFSPAILSQSNVAIDLGRCQTPMPASPATTVDKNRVNPVARLAQVLDSCANKDELTVLYCGCIVIAT